MMKPRLPNPAFVFTLALLLGLSSGCSEARAGEAHPAFKSLRYDEDYSFLVDAVLAEIMSTWNRADLMEFANIMVDHIVPHYRLLIESNDKAQDVQKVGHETNLEALNAGKR